MKKMKRAALAMASVTAISLVGCGGSNTTTTADTKAAGESSAEGGNSGDISGNITFSWWGGDSRHEATEKAIEAFQAKYEGVTVSPEYGAWSMGRETVLKHLGRQLSRSDADQLELDHTV